ncbi:glycosylphosphatidylinositol anchor biosynthesis [Tilletia horrida]|nr:glycosylphosphatidylinositol anchor biosynthesis [Tilletia horrida]
MAEATAAATAAVAAAAPFSVLLLIRLLNAACAQTYFQPDEFWQSLEVAHRIVFGYGHLTWEWRDGRATSPSSSLLSSDDSGWDAVMAGSPVRSIAYPAVFVPVYWALKVLALDDTFLLTLLPRLLQGVFAAVGDWYAFRLARRCASERVAWIFLVLTYTSPYALHTATRTFSNSLETTLTAAALHYWPTSPRGGKFDLRASLLPISLAFMIRPTSAVLWIFLGADLLLRSPRAAPIIVAQCTVAMAGALAVQVLLDSLYFGRLTVTALSFLQVNVLGKSPVSLFYGHSAVHYYFSQGIPVICTALTPWAVVGWASTFRSARAFGGVQQPETVQLLSRAALWVTLCMSTLGHKEWRFLQQLGPLWLLFAAIVLDQRRQESEETGQKRTDEKHGSIGDSSLLSKLKTAWRDICGGGGRPASLLARSSAALPGWAHSLLNRLPSLHYLLYAQIPLTAYLLLGHGRGQTQVMRVLHAQSSKIASVGFLMPCHSTPWQAWLHTPQLEGPSLPSGNGGKAWFLSCEPPLDVEDTKAYRDQTRVFYEDPIEYLKSRFPARVDPAFPSSPYPPSESDALDGSKEWRHTWPSHFVLFETLLREGRRKGGSDQTGLSLGDGEGNTKLGMTVGSYLRSLGYAEVERLWNGFGSDDENRWGDVLVLAWKRPSPS